MVTAWHGGTSHHLGKPLPQPLPARGEGGARDKRPIRDLPQLSHHLLFLSAHPSAVLALRSALVRAIRSFRAA